MEKQWTVGRQTVVCAAETAATYTKLVLTDGELAHHARPGQFLHIKCGENQLRRPISIGGVEGDMLTILFEVKGKGTQWLSQRRPGDVLDVLGPLGHGFPVTEFDGKVLLVGGGIGVPPMHFAAQTLHRCDALLAFRSADRVMLQKEFAALCENVQIMSDDGSVGKQGFAAQGVKEMLSRCGYEAVFACGPRIMLKTVHQVCAAAGVTLYVSMEERMGCGIGACLGCSVPLQYPDGIRHMARACADGPVFRSEEVIWDD